MALAEQKTWIRRQTDEGTIYSSGNFEVKREAYVRRGFRHGGKTAWAWSLYYRGEKQLLGSGYKRAQDAMAAASDGNHAHLS